MVRSIRSWCLAFKLVKSDGGNIVQTDFGKSLLSSNGDGILILKTTLPYGYFTGNYLYLLLRR